jgi:TonB-linked SusC/RagA family outer membrane protein
MRRKNQNFKFLIVFIMFLAGIQAMAQDRTITGTITDPENQPLPGVTVVEKGTVNGAITNIDGAYQVNVTGPDAVLVFSSIGHTTIELVVDNQSRIDLVLDYENFGLNEVVVVGYGTQKKVNLTGAVSAIDGETLSRKPSADVMSSLQGEMPGVAILRSSGQPGSETSGIRIRGFSSANETSALVLIDGVEGDMNLLNPNDIESISVLKDAAASSIYGARAAAGVVLITTKSGGAGKVKVNYHGYYGINIPGNMPERVPAWEEQEMINLGRVNAGGNPEWNPEQSSWVGNPNFNYRPNNNNGRWDYFQATNWVDEGTKDYTTQQNHSVSISGGDQDLNYLLSTGYYTKEGLLKDGPDGYDRYNLRLKLGSTINKYVSFDVQANYSGAFTETNPYNVNNILERLYRVRGRQPIYVPSEDINESIYNGDLQQNAIDIMRNGGITNNRYESYMGKGALTIKNVVEGLSLNLSASRQSSNYNSQVSRRHLIWRDRLGTGVRFQINNPNSLQKTKNYGYHDTFEAVLNYQKELGQHTLTALAGTTFEEYRNDQISGTARNLNSNDFFSFNYYDASEPTNTELADRVQTWAMNSYFGRLNYNFNDRYIVEANIRYDGSSRLAPDYRWQAFPSFSAAWRINEEAWFNLPVVSNFKLRGSWGQLGNGAVLGLYDYIATINSGTHMADAYYFQPSLASQSKTWETIETTNIGIDLGFLNSRLNITGDYYWKTNSDMLASLQLPSILGVGVSNANLGELKSWGWELDLRWRDKIGEVSYMLAFNIADNQNKLVSYNGINTINAGTVGLLEGYELNTIWGYKTDGYWNSREEYLQYKTDNPGYQSFNDGKVDGGDVRYVAQGNPDHMIGAGGGTPEEPGDLVYLGNTNGRFLYGLNLSVERKGFDFSMFFQGVGKRAFLVQTGTITPFWQTSTMPWTVHRDSWTEDNKDAFWPRMYNNNGNDFNFKPSDKWVQNGAYIRLKTVQLGYKIPINESVIENARVYISGNDIWEHTNVLSVFDPEVGNDASANYYPFFRTWSLGLNLTF